MARTNFRLEPLLRIRQMEEDRAKRVVADRLRQIQEVQQRIGSLFKQQDEASQVMRSLVLCGSIVPIEATRQRGYIGGLRQRLAEAHMHLQQLQAQLAGDRALLAEASKRRKILDKLKQRQTEHRLRLANLAEQRAGDELGILRFTHEMLAAAEDPAAASQGSGPAITGL